MLKELFATFLLIHGCASGNLNSIYGRSNNSNDSGIVEKLSPKNAVFTNEISGLYNFKDLISYSNVPQNTAIAFNISIDGSTSPNLLYYCPMYYDTDVYYISAIGLNFDNTTSNPVCILRVMYYNYAGETDYFQFSIYDHTNLTDISSDYQDFYFNLMVANSLESTKLSIFNSIFTHDSNAFVKNYSGYYSFYTGGSFSLPYNINIMGTINNGFNGIILSMSVYYASSNYYWNRIYFNSLNQRYETYEEVFYPQTNLLIDGKMSNDTYNALYQAGVFTFVHDTSYDDTDFHDLLFTIVDTPVYFITSLFNFELFGMNLFIAFSGLLTLAVVIMIIRKIW